ncbi:alpha-ribazole phosphatase family protein, partial [candidate division CSSED10-310 bacterium]
RHTTPEISKGVLYGQSDIEVKSTFAAEVSSIKERLKLDDDFIVYSSPLKRCLKLAQELSPAAVQLDERLKELNFGDWEMKELDPEQQALMSEWMKDFITQRVPNGESFQDLYDRSVSFLNDLLQKTHEIAVVVTHGGVISALLIHILGISPEKLMQLHLDFGGISKISASESLQRVMFINR